MVKFRVDNQTRLAQWVLSTHLCKLLADEAPVGRAFCAWRVRSINQPVTILNIEVADSNLRRRRPDQNVTARIGGSKVSKKKKKTIANIRYSNTDCATHYPSYLLGDNPMTYSVSL